MKTLLPPTRAAVPVHVDLVQVDPTHDTERGDVPGWVLITLMTAGLVVLVWGLAGPALTQLFDRAIASVSGIG